MTADKSGGKSGTPAAAAAAAPGRRRPGTFTPGQDSRRGRGPRAGAENAGRPTDAFREDMAQLLKEPKAKKRLKEILTAKETSDKDFLAAHKYVAERAHGKPPQPIEGGSERKPLLIRLVREGKQ
jgi:hypothetical protein